MGQECSPMTCEQVANFSSKSGTIPCPGVSHRTGEMLAGVEIFRHLPPEALQMLSTRCRWRRYRAHQVIVQCEEKDRDVFFLVSGRACVAYHSTSGHEISFHDLLPGDMFGEFAAIDSAPRSADVIARSEALIVRM